MYEGSTNPCDSKPKKIRTLKKMSLLSSIFRSREDASTFEEVEKIEEKEEEVPCASYSHQGKDIEHGRYLDHQILSDYLVDYRSQPVSFRETLDFPHFILLKEEKRPCSRKEIKGNRFLLSTFDGSSNARTWVRMLEAFFLLHPVASKEAVEISALHLEGEAYDWWCSHLSHARVKTFAEFTQSLVQIFDGERTKEEEITSPFEEACDNTVPLMEEQPHASKFRAANTLEEGILAALQEVPKHHQGMK